MRNIELWKASISPTELLQNFYTNIEKSSFLYVEKNEQFLSKKTTGSAYAEELRMTSLCYVIDVNMSMTCYRSHSYPLYKD